MILLTSNHNYANFLVLALCLFMFDDRDVRRVVPKAVQRWPGTGTARPAALRSGFAVLVSGAVALVIVAASVFQIHGMFFRQPHPQPVAQALDFLRPFRIVNRYHVFPTMKTERIEPVIEGSRDGIDWRVYEFKYKPGDIQRRPQVIVPHHARVDWLMWFVPAHPVSLPWFENFLQRLLQNSPAVLDLLDSNPFPGQSPRYLRVSAYRYRFASPEIRKATGQWRTREYLGPFFPLPGMEAGTGQSG